jgi:hypothetical protein
MAARDRTRFRAGAAGRGGVEARGPLVEGRPPVMVTTFRTETYYPRIVAYVAWFDHTRTSLRYCPVRYDPPSAPTAGRFRFRLVSAGGFLPPRE